MSMCASFFCCVTTSLLTEHLFKSGALQPELDVLGCVVNISSERIALPSDTSFNVSCETLAMQKMRSTGNGAENSSLLSTNGVHTNGSFSPGEATALHPGHQDYLSTEAR
uniref:Uncharacterized protein n=1 Tax=Panagrolaimus davidi TaxID=227884 RepID=A0A914QKJ6_9BILA